MSRLVWWFLTVILILESLLCVRLLIDRAEMTEMREIDRQLLENQLSITRVLEAVVARQNTVENIVGDASEIRLTMTEIEDYNAKIAFGTSKRAPKKLRLAIGGGQDAAPEKLVRDQRKSPGPKSRKGSGK